MRGAALVARRPAVRQHVRPPAQTAVATDPAATPAASAVNVHPPRRPPRPSAAAPRPGPGTATHVFGSVAGAPGRTRPQRTSRPCRSGDQAAAPKPPSQWRAEQTGRARPCHAASPARMRAGPTPPTTMPHAVPRRRRPCMAQAPPSRSSRAGSRSGGRAPTRPFEVDHASHLPGGLRPVQPPGELVQGGYDGPVQAAWVGGPAPGPGDAPQGGPADIRAAFRAGTVVPSCPGKPGDQAPARRAMARIPRARPRPTRSTNRSRSRHLGPRTGPHTLPMAPPPVLRPPWRQLGGAAPDPSGSPPGRLTHHPA